MTWASGWELRGETNRAANAWPFAVCLAVAVVIGWVGRLIRWALREGWYRPLLATAVVVSTLATYWIGPVAGAITFAAAGLGRVIWLVRRLAASQSASGARAIAASVTALSRGIYRAWVLKRRWRRYAAPFLKVVDGLTGLPPKPRQWQVQSPVRATCVMNVATTGRDILDDIAPEMALCAQTLRLHSASVEPVRGRPGLARFTWYWGSLLDEVQQLTALPDPKPGWAWFGLGADGEPAGTRMEFSTLYVGESRSGKSTAMWAEMLSMVEQEQAGGEPVEFWIIDLALTEFAAARPLTQDPRPQFANPDSYDGHRYARTNDQANGLLRMAWAEAERRGKLMVADDARKLEPTQEMPRIVIVIDELLRLIEKTGGRKASDQGNEAEGLVRMLLTQAAKFGIVIRAGTQASKVQVMTSVRDWFQQRVAFSTSTTHMTDCALGEGAHAVAGCDKLNVHRDAGRGWMYLDGRSGYHPFRGVWIDDKAARDIGRGRVPDRLLEARGQQTSKSRKPGAVYIFWGPEDEAGNRVCLYVGKTDQARPEVRWRRHLWGVDDKEWADLADRLEVRNVGSARRAEKLEREIIRELQPLANVRRYETPTEYEKALARSDR